MLSVIPMYDSSLLSSCLVTMAWYIRLDIWHFSSTGNVSFIWQLQLFVVFSMLLSLISIALLWFDMICFMFGMH